MLGAWDSLIPYSERDLQAFAEDGADLAVQRVRLERDREALYTWDVFLYNRTQRRRMVLQFVTLKALDGQWRIEVPSAFRALGPSGHELVRNALLRVLQEFEHRPELRSAPIIEASFPAPSNVPALTGAGEGRVTPGFAWNELYVHSAKRYIWATEQVPGRCVLDLGCGSGYGAKFLARTAKQVVAVDVDRAPVEYGQETYPDPLVTRLQIDRLTRGNRLPLADASVDAVVCCEVVEHVPVEDMEAFFAEIGRVLKLDGLLLMSTPNKTIYRHYPDPHHVSLMGLEEFRLLLESRFRDVIVFGQVRSQGLPHTSLEFDIVPRASAEHEIFVAMCRGYCGEERRIALPPPTIWDQIPRQHAPGLLHAMS